MSFPVSYFSPEGDPIEGAAGSSKAFELARQSKGDLGADELKWALGILDEAGLVATLMMPHFDGAVARVRIDAYGKSASEIEATLLQFAERCDAASQANGCSYGECVIERNLEEQWGESYSWRGRLVLHPNIGMMPSSERAAAAIAE